MADLMLTPVAGQTRLAPQMSLGDMLNLARGAQQYQQAQQINPLELQQKQQATRTGEIALGVEEQKNKERQNFQQFMANPANYMTDNKFDQTKFNAAIPQIMPLTGVAAMKDLTNLAQAQSEALTAKQNLTQSSRQLVASRVGILGRAGVKDPNIVNQELNNLIAESDNDPEVARLVKNAYIPTFGRIPPDQLPDALIKAGQSLWTPAQQQTALAPTISTTAEGRTVTTQPAIGAAAPTSTIGVAGGLQPQQPTQPAGPIGAGTEVSPGMRVPYPVRSANQPFIPEPTEAKDLAAGEAYRTSLVNRQGKLSTDRRNVEEALSQTKSLEAQLYRKEGGLLQDIERKMRMAINSDEYKMLSKDLANLQITNMNTLGAVGNTVAGIDLTRVANGDETIPPKVLTKIIRRTQADMTNIDMQATGAQKFYQQFGDNNMKAFQQAWNANADSRIFEAMNIMRDEQNPQEKQKKLEELFPTPAKRRTFLKKYRNLKSMFETGVPVEKLTDEDR